MDETRFQSPEYSGKLFGLVLRPLRSASAARIAAAVALLAAVCMEGGTEARADDVSIKWQTGSTGTILFDNNSESYPDQVAIVVDKLFGGVYRESVVEKLGGKTVTRIKGISRFGGDYISGAETPGFHGKEYKGEVEYGTWYSSSDYNSQSLSCPTTHCINILFRPNAEKINSLSAEDVVYETYTYTPFLGGKEMTKQEITVTITRKQ